MRRRPHRHVLRLRAARRPAGRRGARQRPRERAPDRSAARRRRGGRSLRARRPRLDLRRQPGYLRGRLRRPRRARRRAARRRARAWARASRRASPSCPPSSEVRGAGLLVGCDLDRPAGRVVAACLERGLVVGTAGEQGPPADAAADRLGATRSTRRSRSCGGARSEPAWSVRAPSCGSFASSRSRRRPSSPRRCARPATTSSRRPSRATSPSSGSSRCAPPSGRLVYAPPGARDSDRLPRARARAAPLGAHASRRAATSSSSARRAATRTPLADAIDEAGHPDVDRDHRRREHDLRRRPRGRHRRRAARELRAATPWKELHDVAKTAVLAYSGGLDTTCAIAWLTRGLRLRRGRRRPRRRRAGVRPRGRRSPRPGSRRGRRAPARPKRGIRRRPGRKGTEDERALRGQVPARLGALAPRHRRGRRLARARARRRGGRARLHRQGQRPASLRARVQGQLPRRDA